MPVSFIGVLVAAMAIWAPPRLSDFRKLQITDYFAFAVIYPLVSVLAQEVLYRRYLFHRLKELQLSPSLIVWVSAIAFAAMHTIFRNEIAVALTLIGGWFFSDTYQRSGSLRLVCLEHALYGNFVFAIGLWPFFSNESNACCHKNVTKRIRCASPSGGGSSTMLKPSSCVST